LARQGKGQDTNLGRGENRRHSYKLHGGTGSGMRAARRERKATGTLISTVMGAKTVDRSTYEQSLVLGATESEKRGGSAIWGKGKTKVGRETPRPWSGHRKSKKGGGKAPRSKRVARGEKSGWEAGDLDGWIENMIPVLGRGNSGI